MQKPNTILEKKMDLPGVDLFKKISCGNTPLKDGLYVVYYNHIPPAADSNLKKSSAVAIASFFDGTWGFNHKVYAYIGPIPILSLPSLLDCKPPYAVNQTFYTGTLKQAANGRYTTGPHSLSIIAVLQPQIKDHFVFCIDSENIEPYPISKVNLKSKGAVKWKDLSEKAIKKYSKMMKTLVNHD